METLLETPDFFSASGSSPPPEDLSRTSADEDETRSRTRDYYFSIIPEALLDAPISSKAYHLYGILDRYAGENRLAFPARKTLAKRLRCSLSTVDRAIDELVAAGFLTVKRSYRSDGGKRPSLYILHTQGADLTHGGDSPELAHRDGPDLTHTHGADLAPGDGAVLTHLNESHIEREREETEPEGMESQADCVGSVVPSPGLQLLSSQPEDSGETLRDFSDEATTPRDLPQPERSRTSKPKAKPKLRPKSQPDHELADALAKADLVIVQELFETWAETGKGKSHPSDERLGLIARALVDWGFPAEDVRDALTGWVNDPWEDRPRFKDVKYLLGSVEKVEAFRDLKRNPPKKKRDQGAGMRANVSDMQSYLDFNTSTAFGKKAKTPEGESI